MAIYSEDNGTTLLDGFTDTDGDTITVYRINGTIISSWPHTESVTINGAAKNVTISQAGIVTYDDAGDTSRHPANSASNANAGSFTFTAWDGQAESATHTATVALDGLTGGGGGGGSPSPAEVLNNLDDQELTYNVAMSSFDTAADFNVAISSFAATDLPKGLSINSGTGAITGTPTTPGEVQNVIITGTKSDSTTLQTSVRLEISDSIIANAPGATGYSAPTADYTVNAAGGADATTIAAGLALASSGEVVEVAGSASYNESVTIPNGVTLSAATGSTGELTGFAAMPSSTACANASDAFGNPNWESLRYIDFPESSFDWSVTPTSVQETIGRMVGMLMCGNRKPYFVCQNRLSGNTDRERQQLMLWPNAYYEPGGFDNTTNDTLTSLQYLAGQDQTAMETYGMIWARTSPNTSNFATISSFNTSTGAATLGTWCQGGNRPYWSNSSKHHFAVWNNPYDLYPGSMCFARNSCTTSGTGTVRIVYWPRESGETMEFSKYEVGVSIAGRSNTTVTGLTINGYSGRGDHDGGAVTDNSGSAAISGNTISYNNISLCGNFGDKGLGSIFLRKADNTLIRNNTIKDCFGTLNTINLNGDTANGSTAVSEFQAGNYDRFCDTGVIARNLMINTSRSPVTLYGGIDIWIVDNRVAIMGSAHANTVTLYNSCVRPVVMRNWFTNSMGYISTQDNSNIAIFGNLFGPREFASFLDNRVINNDGAAYAAIVAGGTHYVFCNTTAHDGDNPTNHDVRIGIQGNTIPDGNAWNWVFEANICTERVLGNATEEGRVTSEQNIYVGTQGTPLGTGEVDSDEDTVWGSGETAFTRRWRPAAAGPASGGLTLSRVVPSVPAGVTSLMSISTGTDIMGTATTWDHHGAIEESNW